MSTTTVLKGGLNDQDEKDIAFLENDPNSPPLDASAATAEASEPKLCFDAKTWNQCIQYTLQLTEVFRQRDPEFIKMLTEMRHGKLSEETCQIFQQLERTPEYPDDGIKATELFALRRQVEQANERHLAELSGPMYVYEPQDDGPLKHFMDRYCTASSRLKLKVNAQVMLVKNLTPSLVNGSMGLVVGFQENMSYEEDTGTWNKSHFPVVRFQGQEYDLVIKPEEWKMEMPNGEVMASRIQVPLILAWAMSTCSLFKILGAYCFDKTSIVRFVHVAFILSLSSQVSTSRKARR
ncbi:MAG: hypothetical protein J3Q66DRAFT_66979 [Benniella sp.]|nr:MAG: hypothetical protein J3Q66DRAFT_66979 [Benniella sp.]